VPKSAAGLGFPAPRNCTRLTFSVIVSELAKVRIIIDDGPVVVRSLTEISVHDSQVAPIASEENRGVGNARKAKIYLVGWDRDRIG
jgi:hypothetical protein